MNSSFVCVRIVCVQETRTHICITRDCSRFRNEEIFLEYRLHGLQNGICTLGLCRTLTSFAPILDLFPSFAAQFESGCHKNLNNMLAFILMLLISFVVWVTLVRFCTHTHTRAITLTLSANLCICLCFDAFCRQGSIS